MKIAVFGLGYVGTVTAACMAARNHTVIGVDKNPAKVSQVNGGASPVLETGLDGLVADAVKRGHLAATTDVNEAVGKSELAFVCVGTPSARNGSPDLLAMKAVSEEIGNALRTDERSYCVVVRSTVLPGTAQTVVRAALESCSGRQLGPMLGLANNPEFLREGTAVKDFNNPPKTVIGGSDEDTVDRVAKLYDGLPGPLIKLGLEEAEMIKYVDNTWHALKVAFANEIGNVCSERGLDSYRVMDAFVADTKLNISPAYLKPGFAFGGSCLPKDCRAFGQFARASDLDLPVVNAILRSNVQQIERALQMIGAMGGRRVALLGLSFKDGTDDLRESPLVELAERLLGKGYRLRICDKNVQLARLTGTNREFIFTSIPHLSELMTDSISDAIGHAEIVVIGNHDHAATELLKYLHPGQNVLDLARLPEVRRFGGAYTGINW